MIGTGPLLDRRLTHLLTETAKQNDIPFQLEVMGGETGTNAHAYQCAACGIPSVLISIPLRYMHTQTETASLEDFENAARLGAAFIERFGRDEQNV